MNVWHRGAIRTGIMVAALAMMNAAPAQAQGYDFSAGWGGGYMTFAPYVDSGADTPEDIGMGSTWVAVVQGESWYLGRRVGARIGGSYAHGTVTLPDADKRAALVGLEAAALLRLFSPHPANRMNAYVIGGGGINWFAMGDNGQDIVPISGSNVVYDANDKRRFLALGGAGVELLPGWTLFESEIGVRMEAIDHITFGAPFRPVNSTSSGSAHNLRFTITLFSAVD